MSYWLAFNRRKLLAGAGLALQAAFMGLRDAKRRHHLLNVFNDGIHQRALDGRMHIGNFSNDNVFYAGMGQNFLGVFCHIRQHNQGLGTGIVELMFHFASGIQRVSVNHNQASTHGAKYHNWILIQVGHLHGNTVTGLRYLSCFAAKPQNCAFECPDHDK